MKKFWDKYKGAIIVVVLLCLFVLLSVLTEKGNKQNNKDKISLDKLTTETKAWLDTTESDEYVVTVLAQTQCSYCIKFKPVMEEVQVEKGFKLYWYEVDEIVNAENREEDYKAITTYYNIEYTGTPHTYITHKGELVAELSGFREKAELESFLKANKVISE